MIGDGRVSLMDHSNTVNPTFPQVLKALRQLRNLNRETMGTSSHATHFPEVVGCHLNGRGNGAVNNRTTPTSQQKQRKRPCCSTRHESAPSPKPTKHRRLSHDFWLAPCFGRHQTCQELACLLGPTSSHLATQDHQPGATMRLSQLGACALLPPPGLVQSCSLVAAHCLLAVPSLLTGDTMVVSMAKCAPLNSGRQTGEREACHRSLLGTEEEGLLKWRENGIY